MRLCFFPGLPVILAVLLVYAGVLLSGPFGYNDDYQYLQRVYSGTFDPAHNEQIGMGRPAASWLIEAAYGLCLGSVRNLVYLRLASVVGLTLLTVALCRTLRRAGQGEKTALAVALSVAFSPACGVYAAWAAAFLSPYALLLCLLAGLLLEPRATHQARRWWRRLSAVLLIVLSCCLWQAAAPMALFVGFVGTWRRVKEGEPFRTAVRSSGVLPAWGIVGTSLAFYLLTDHLAMRFAGGHRLGQSRMTLTTDAHAKFRLLGDLMRSGFGSWARLHSLAWEWPVAGLTLLAVVAAIIGRSPAKERTGRWGGTRAALAAVMLLASVAPLLVASENNAAYRSLPVLYATVAFLAAEGAAGCWPETLPRLGAAVSGGLIVLLGMSAAYNVQAGIVAPNVREYRAVSQLIARQFRKMPPRLVYLLPPYVLLAPETMKTSWEYGLVSSPFWWVTKPFLLLVFHDQGMCPNPSSERLDIVFREAGHADLPVLNPMGAMLNEAGSWRIDARFGKVLAFSNGWIYSPWFGYLEIKRFPFVQHHIMGPMWYVGSGSGDLWLYKEGLGKFFTSEASFPNLYVSERKGWVFLLDTDRSHCAVRIANGQELLLSKSAVGPAELSEGVNIGVSRLLVRFPLQHERMPYGTSSPPLVVRQRSSCGQHQGFLSLIFNGL